MIEEWKDIKNFSNYQASNLGNIKSKKHNYTRKDGISGIRKEKILSNKITDKSKYINVVLKNNDGNPINLNVHSIIAETWILKDDNNLIVNHIDGNKHNNCVDNLEWVTYGNNLKHAYEKSLRFANKKPCKIVDSQRCERFYDSVKELSESEDLNYQTVTASVSKDTYLQCGSKIYYI